MGFPDSSVGKESVCNARDLGSIPGSRRSAGEGIGYPLQYSWASLVAQLVKNPPAMWETWALSLSWEDPLEKGKATHFSILAWRISWTVWSMGSQRVRHDWATELNWTELDSILKSRDITLPTKVHLVKAMVFPVVMYGCESWTIKKAENQRIDAFELWSWRRLSPLDSKEIKPVNPKGNQHWVFIGRTDGEAEA